MNGGVDSSATAALLIEQGYDVIGITLKLWPQDCVNRAVTRPVCNQRRSRRFRLRRDGNFVVLLLNQPMKKSFLIMLALLGGWVCLNGFGQIQPVPRPPATATNAPGRLTISQDKPAASKMFDSWKSTMPPRHIIGNIYYVGMSGVCCWLITTPDGNILIDSTFEECVPQICKNIEQLGFRVGDTKWLLSSHAHVDHTGGHALMKKMTGARIVSSAADARILESGGKDDFSPF